MKMILSFSFKSVHNCTSPTRVSVSSAINYNSCLLRTQYPCFRCSHVHRHGFPLVCTAVSFVLLFGAVLLALVLFELVEFIELEGNFTSSTVVFKIRGGGGYIPL